MIPFGSQGRRKTQRGSAGLSPRPPLAVTRLQGHSTSMLWPQTPPGISAASSGARLLPWHTLLTQAGTPDACPAHSLTLPFGRLSPLPLQA